ncbi:MAG TPA: DUF3368 domain-containing protein [bacterium]|nr:DUF3368 domain-containing protein [bacterium]
MIVVSNTSPILNLLHIGKLDILQHLFDEVIIPEEVRYELLEKGPYPKDAAQIRKALWLRTEKVENSDLLTALKADLDDGEAAAIALAIEKNADLLLIDEKAGRALAAHFDVEMAGVLGVLVIAKRKKLIRAVSPMLKDLVKKAGFRITDQLKATILKMSDEA